MAVLGRRRSASCNYRGTRYDGMPVEYVRRRDGGYTPIPVGPDGKVPVEELVKRNIMRDPHARMMDEARTAKVVRPMDLTPSQAAPWFNAPGRSDIAGIDAPNDATVTWKPKDKAKGRSGKGKTSSKAKGERRLTASEAEPYAELVSGIVMDCQVGQYELVEKGGRRFIIFPLIAEKNGRKVPNCDLEHYFGFYRIEDADSIYVIDLDDPYQPSVPQADRAGPSKRGSVPKAQRSAPVAPPDNGRFYYHIDEELARRGLESYSWSSYQPGSATANYRRTVDQVYDMAEEAKRTARPALHDEIDSLARQFAERYGRWVNTKNSIDASNVSPMIAGGSRYNYKKRDKQSARADAHWQEHERIMEIPDRIKELGRPDRNVDIREDDAIGSLDGQIAELEKRQEWMKRVNAYWRKNKTMKGCPDIPANLQKSVEDAITSGGRASDKPFEDFELTSNREKIKRLKKKRDDLSRTKAAGASETEHGDIEVREDTEDMRVRIIFPDKPDEAVRTILKQNGFRWSPSTSSWQRQLNDAGREATRRALDQIRRIARDEYGMSASENRRRGR